MEDKPTNLLQWTVEDVGKEITKKFNEDIAKKFEGEILRSAKVRHSILS